MHNSSSIEVLDLLKQKQNVVLLLSVPDDPLCARAHQALTTYAKYYKTKNFYVLNIVIDEESQKVAQLSCVHVPKTKVFIRGNCRKEIRGIPTTFELDHLIEI